MKVLITGGAGFLGSYLCEAFLKLGYEVIALDNLFSGSLKNINQLLSEKNFRFIKGDVRNERLIRKLTKDVFSIYHLAAQVHVDRSIRDPKLTFDVNIKGSYNVLESAIRNDVERVIFASSCEVYGNPIYLPIDENHPFFPTSPYAASKVAEDRLCCAYISTYGLPAVITRCFNFFGPRQKDEGYGAVIPIFIKRVFKNKPPIIYGDGKQTRDFTYIEDVVRFYLQIDKKFKKIKGLAINFGRGKETSINELARLIIKLVGKKVKPIHTKPRQGELKRSYADITLCRRKLKIQPMISLEEGIKKMIEWYTKVKR